MKEKIQGVLGALLFFAAGIFMIVNPELMEGAEASGRKSWLKQILIWIWCRPVGIILTILSIFTFYGAISSHEDEETSA